MANIPDTSTTLLKALASSAENARWGEFAVRYEPMMRAYLSSRFPGVEADDVIQETMLALVRTLPNYRYDPEHHGFFRHYLTGILRNKALDALRKSERRQRLIDNAGDNPGGRELSDGDQVEEEEWRKSVFAVALEEFLADPAVTERSKRMFVRVYVRQESRQQVADAFGVSLNAVNLSVNRSLKYFRARAEELKDL